MSPQIKKHMKDVDKIRAEAFPSHTCPASRHAHIMAETLAKGKEYAMFLEEPEHCADTLLAVIGSLWQARMKAAELERQLAEAQKDAGRYRWLRDQHEGLMPMEIDADGDLMPRELRALAFTVFYPDPSERESLVPVPIGDLDETIDAAIKENHAD